MSPSTKISENIFSVLTGTIRARFCLKNKLTHRFRVQIDFLQYMLPFISKISKRCYPSNFTGFRVGANKGQRNYCRNPDHGTVIGQIDIKKVRASDIQRNRSVQQESEPDNEPKFLPLHDITEKLIQGKWKTVVNLCSKATKPYDSILEEGKHPEIDKIRKEVAEVYSFQSDAYANLKRSAKVIEALKKAIDIYPCSDYYGDLADYLLFTEDYEGAIQYADLSLSMNDDEADPYSIKAMALLELGRYDEIPLLCRIASSKDPQGAAPHITMAKLYLKFNEYAKAMKQIERAIGKEGESWNLLKIKAEIMSKVRRYDDAYEAIIKLVRYEKDNIEGRLVAANLLIKAKRIVESIPHFDYILSSEDSSDEQIVKAAREKAKVCLKLNQAEHAKKAVEKAIELGIDEKKLRNIREKIAKFME